MSRLCRRQHSRSIQYLSRFDELERKHIAESTPNWRWCLNSECRAGQIHVPKLLPPESETQESPAKRRKRNFNPFKKADAPAPQIDSPDIMTCNSCSARTCVPCDRPLHDGETCSAYQARVKDRVEEEDKTMQAIRKLSRPCPSCGRNIQKNGGCPGMFCTQCKAGFCKSFEGVSSCCFANVWQAGTARLCSANKVTASATPTLVCRINTEGCEERLAS